MRDKELKVEYEPTEKLVSYKNNAKIHTGEQVDQIKRSIEEFGFNDPIAVWTNPDGKSEIVEGHGRLLAAQELGIAEVPVIHLDTLTDEQRRAYTHVHNQLTMNTGWDFETLELDLVELDFDFDKFGFDLFDEKEAVKPTDLDEHKGSLSERFGVAPFSVLNARGGEWGERKRLWMALGIRSEIGREGGLAYLPGLLGKIGEYKAAENCN